MFGWIFAILIMMFSFAIAVDLKERSKYPDLYLSLFLIVGIVFSGTQAIVIHSRNYDAIPISQTYTKVPDQPNIYFIVPDRMPSPQAMIESGLDPEPLVSTLQELDFYVPDNKQSADLYTLDYPNKIYTTRTMRFFASILNSGKYIPTEIPYIDCRSMIRDNEIFTLLHDKGYQIINYASWFTETKQFSAADQNITYGDINILERFVQNELGEAYLDRTILRGLPLRTLFNNEDTEIRRHNWQMDSRLETAKSGCTSTFVISHIMMPHEPFVYADNSKSELNQYYDNINYALTYIKNLAERIRTSDPTAIVIIQSDEGMAFSKPPELNKELSLIQWNGVFTAWYLPWELKTGGFLDNLDNIEHTSILDIVLNNT